MDDGLVLYEARQVVLGELVLILIVVDNGLVPSSHSRDSWKEWVVLILIVVDDGLVHAYLDTKTRNLLS